MAWMMGPAMPTAKKNLPARRPQKRQGRAVELVQVTVPKPMPKGVCIVYDPGAQALVYRTTSLKSVRELMAAIRAGVTR